VKPGKTGTTASQMASAGHLIGAIVTLIQLCF
jgi:hypothetical protein